MIVPLIIIMGEQLSKKIPMNETILVHVHQCTIYNVHLTTDTV